MIEEQLRYYTDVYGIFLFRMKRASPEVYSFTKNDWVSGKELFDVWSNSPLLVDISYDDARSTIEHRRR